MSLSDLFCQLTSFLLGALGLFGVYCVACADFEPSFCSQNINNLVHKKAGLGTG